MAITTAQYERITRFLDAGMDIEDMNAFEAELAANPEIRQQLDFELFVRDRLASNNTNIANHGIALPGNKQPAIIPKKTTTSKGLSFKMWLATGVAASIIVAFSVLFLYNQPSKKYQPVVNQVIKDTGLIIKDIPSNTAEAPLKERTKTIDELALVKKFYTKDKLPESYPVFLADAFTRFESGDYDALQQLNLSDISETRGGNDLESKENILQLAHYYKGISYLETGNTAKAIVHFNWVLTNNPGKRLLAKAEWFLALAYLKEHEPGKTIELLKKIPGDSPENEYSQQAKALLHSLKNER